HAGRLAELQHDDQRTTYLYDTLGREKEIHRYFGYQPHEYLKTTKEYDLLDRLIKETEQDSQGHLYTQVEYTYDPDGNRTSTKTDNSLTTFTYNARHQLTQTQDPNGHTTQIQYTYQPRTQTTTDPLGHTTLELYDALGHLQQQQKEQQSIQY